MYSEQIEQLIKSVIADGVITEKERAVLHKRAAAEGIDEDEIDVYVDGLIAQMKVTAPDLRTPITANIDLKFLDKYAEKDGYVYYLGQKFYDVKGVSNNYINKIYLNFFKEIESESGKEKFGVAIVFIYQKGKRDSSNYPTLVFKTDSNTIQLSYTYSCYLSFPQSLKPRDGNVNGDISLNFIDNEMMKLLCDSSHLTMSLLNCSSTIDSHNVNDRMKNEKKNNYKNIPADELLNYARVFYRSIIDNSAYPDAVINENESSESYIFSIDDQKVIRLITENPQKYEQIKPCPSCFKLYKSVNSFIIVHVNSTADFEEKDQEIKLEALTDNKGNTRFFLVYIDRWRIENMTITVNMNDHQLAYLVNDDKRNDDYADDKNYAFFEINNSLLKEMFRTKHDILLNNEKLNDLPAKWREAFDYLTNPQKLTEWKKQYEENNQSGIFGKLKNLLG